MSLVQAKCTSCGANLTVNPDNEASVCKYCGTAFITEKAIDNFNATINSESVSISGQVVNIFQNTSNNEKSIEELIENGKAHLAILFSNKEDSDALKQISKEILDKDPRNFFGNYFLLVSQITPEITSLDSALIFKTIELGSKEEKSMVIAHVLNVLTIKFTTLSKFNSIPHTGLFVTLKFLNTISQHFSIEEKEIYEKCKALAITTAQNAFSSTREKVASFWFSENSVKEFEFEKVLCNLITKLALFYEGTKDLIGDCEEIKKNSDFIKEIIYKNREIISKNQIYSPILFEDLEKLPGDKALDLKNVSSDVSFTPINNAPAITYKLFNDRIEIMYPAKPLIIQIKDILFINSHFCILKRSKDCHCNFIDIVYRISPEQISCERMICEMKNDFLIDADDIDINKLTGWIVHNNIRDLSEDWNGNLPIRSGYNGMRFVPSNSGLYFVSSGLSIRTVEFSPNSIYIDDFECLYSNISNIEYRDFLGDKQIRIKDDSSKLYYPCIEATKGGYEEAQLKKIYDELLRRIKENNPNQVVNNKRMGCYVATCAYGSYDCPEVWTLRRYRDNTLAKTWYGRAFIRIYYKISPTLVKCFGNTKWFKKLCRGKLDKFVKKLNEKGYENTPYQDKNW